MKFNIELFDTRINEYLDYNQWEVYTLDNDDNIYQLAIIRDDIGNLKVIGLYDNPYDGQSSISMDHLEVRLARL